MASLLLYNFAQGETVQLQALVGFLPDVRVIPVDRGSYGMLLSEVLAGKAPPAVAFSRKMDRKMLVIADAKGEELTLLLSGAGQVTKGQNILRAVVTETNRNWTGSYLYEHLLEEEAKLKSMQK